jgi:hypothetical protein
MDGAIPINTADGSLPLRTPAPSSVPPAVLTDLEIAARAALRSAIPLPPPAIPTPLHRPDDEVERAFSKITVKYRQDPVEGNNILDSPRQGVR